VVSFQEANRKKEQEMAHKNAFKILDDKKKHS
jgi:hypothetical protein